MRATADRWEVLLDVPRDIGDLGLHQPEDLAAAHFRRQLSEELGAEHAARVGPAAEQQFRRARAMHAGRPVLWGGFILTATPAAAGLPVDTSGWPADPAEHARLSELAATQDGMLVSLTVAVRELVVPDLHVAPAAALGRSIQARFGDVARVHLVAYGDVPGVAVVRPQAVGPGRADDGADGGGADIDGADGGGADGDPPPAAGELVLAEVHLLFPDDDALVTVTAATPNYGAVNDAVLLAGSIARSIRVRPADPGKRAERAVEAPQVPARAGGGARLAVVLPDGQQLPTGLSLVGRAPQHTAEPPSDHTVTLRDPSISRTHVALQVDAGRVVATDLHSTNGTVVRRRDGRTAHLVPGVRTELHDGDRLNLGTAVLRVEAR